MTLLSGSFNGTRVNDSNSATNWTRFQTGGGAPATESPLAYQGALAVNVQVKATTTTEGVQYDHSGTASFDMTAAGNRLWFVKLYVSDSFAIHATRGAEVACGSSSSTFDRFVISGTHAVRSVYTTYPARVLSHARGRSQALVVLLWAVLLVFQQQLFLLLVAT